MRIEAGLSKAEASRLIGVSESAWSLWESGQRKMHVAMFELFAIKTAAARMGPIKLIEAIRDAERRIYESHERAPQTYRDFIDQLAQ